MTFRTSMTFRPPPQTRPAGPRLSRGPLSDSTALKGTTTLIWAVVIAKNPLGEDVAASSTLSQHHLFIRRYKHVRCINRGIANHAWPSPSRSHCGFGGVDSDAASHKVKERQVRYPPGSDEKGSPVRIRRRAAAVSGQMLGP